MFNPFYYPMFYPWLPNDNDKPPTIYSLLESIVNYGKDEKTKIKDLASVGRTTFFDFNYPLSSKISKQDFETMILNHFLMRRIGYDTLTAFKIQLNVKLNEIMPMYNKMFDVLDGWNIFEDGEEITRNTTDNRNINNTNETTSKDTNNETHNNTNSSNNNTTNELKNNSSSESNTINDRRYSDTPQNELNNVQNGNYVTEYNYDTTDINSSDNSTSNGTSTSENISTSTDIINSTKDGKINSSSNTEDNNISNETIKRTPADKIRIYREFLESKQNIYTMIFNDLECLFYQLI